MAFLQDNDTLLFIGDSLTDSGRRDPVHAPYGNGYVNGFRNLVTVRNPGTSLRILNRGVGGNTAEDLASRWADDVLAEKPDMVSVLIGINDVNQYTTHPDDNALQSPQRYREYLADCLERTREALPGVKLVLITPFYLSRDDSDHYRGRVCRSLQAYHRAVCELAEVYDALLVDTRAAFDAALEHLPPSAFSHDMVHLNEAGALLLSETVYQHLLP